MAFVRDRTHNDGTTVFSVTYRQGGRGSKQSSTTFPTRQQADRFCALVGQFGPDRAHEMAGISNTPERAMSSLTVAEYLDRHIDNLTGVEKKTVAEYRRYLVNDISPVLGAIPLGKLTRSDVAAWINGMAEGGSSGKTIGNKAGFLSGALNRAVEDGHIVANPCHKMRLPRTEQKRPPMYLTRDEFKILKAAFSEHYQPLVEFLVASGCRPNEALALKPSDVDQEAGTVSIVRSWHPGGADGWYLGPPKTEKSVRTINVPKSVLKQLDYSNEWLFVSTSGKPIRLFSWRANVWYKSLAKAKKNGLTRSVAIKDLRTTCGSWMLQGGVDLALVQEHLGHESYETTRRHYAHLDRRNHEAAASVIASILDM